MADGDGMSQRSGCEPLFARTPSPTKSARWGPPAFNAIPLIVNAALAGLALAYLPEDVVQQQVSAGHLARVLADWSPRVIRYHLYYPNR
jgi:DNA-binding transcriptional LysR family regulator